MPSWVILSVPLIPVSKTNSTIGAAICSDVHAAESVEVVVVGTMGGGGTMVVSAVKTEIVSDTGLSNEDIDVVLKSDTVERGESIAVSVVTGAISTVGSIVASGAIVASGSAVASVAGAVGSAVSAVGSVSVGVSAGAVMSSVDDSAGVADSIVPSKWLSVSPATDDSEL